MDEAHTAVRGLADGSLADVGERALWLYDGHCGFCSWSVRFLLARERGPSTLFVAIQSSLGREIAQAHGVDPDEPSTFVFVDHGGAHEKSDGIVALADHLRWPWRALRWIRFVPRAARDLLYDLLARNRYRIFGRQERCEVPSPQVRARFVVPE